MLKLGNTVFDAYPLLLAPMEDITDPSFRHICKLHGADLMFTEFISSEGLTRKAQKSMRKLDINDQERPVGIQLYGQITESMVKATIIAEKVNPDLIDLNFGCPVKKISRNGAGAGMLKDIPLMIRMTREIVKTTTLPVTVKTRLGWDEKSKNIVDIALRLQDAGIKLITIHARTATQMYRGNADWTLIGEVKNHPGIHIPVIGNGDVDSPEKAKEAFKQYGVDGIMIGRAVVGRPWIFRDIKHYITTGEILPPPAIEERVNIARTHFNKSLEQKGELRGIFEMRKHFSHYFKGLPDFKDLRFKLVTSKNVKEISDIFDIILEKYS